MEKGGMGAMLRKAYTPARLFTESILFLLMGSLMLLHPEKTLVLALDALRWLLPAGGIINLTEWLLHGRQKRIALVKGVALLAGGLTLVIMILPTIVRTTQESLKTVPQSYREGSLALGAGKWHMVRTVVLPNAVDGIVTGCILAIGRIVGESAALLFTAGFGLELNNFLTSMQASSATLTVALYVYANERGETGVAFAIAAVLMILVLVINFSATFAGRKLKRKAG